jgi:hypothetical protein
MAAAQGFTNRRDRQTEGLCNVFYGDGVKVHSGGAIVFVNKVISFSRILLNNNVQL